MNAISDHHEIEHEFEELQPTIGGIRLDTYFSGNAFLAADPNYSFYVKRIILDGTVEDRLAKPSPFGRRPRKAVKLVLERPAKDDMSAEAHLFRQIEAEIYEDENALAAWQSEIEEAA